jgi:hypothetical protein
LTPEEYDALKADIEAHGVLEYVHVDENGEILVGHHRAQVALELGIEYPRHVVVGLTEQQKHEYAVRLESLGRATDSETKQWTALDLWHDPNVRVSKTKLAGLLGVHEASIRRWLKAGLPEHMRDGGAFGGSRTSDGGPEAPPERVPDARGRMQPTSHATYRRSAEPSSGPEGIAEPANGDVVGAAAADRVDTKPKVGDVRAQIAEQFDDEALAAEQRLAQHIELMARVRVTWLRFMIDNPPDVFTDGLDRGETEILIRDLDRFLDWLTQAKACAEAAKRPRRVV